MPYLTQLVLNTPRIEAPAAKAATATLQPACPVEFGARTDTGRVRHNNEDSFLAAPEMHLFALSDGMGGLSAGEVASRLTVNCVAAHCRDADADPTLEFVGAELSGISPASNRLASAVRFANRIVYDAAHRHSAQHGMGATVVAVRFTQERMTVAHVGDSRAYRLRGRHLEQLTQDHSLVAEQVRRGQITERQAGASGLRNVLMRGIGVESEVAVDVSEELVMEQDIVLLCSDGLTRELSDSQIAHVLAAHACAQTAADRLVDLAGQAGGLDNITAVVLRPSLGTGGRRSGARILGRWFSGLVGQT
jgi:serine/threonine protein phosphatase PrpC